jgi:hypothetical protein
VHRPRLIGNAEPYGRLAARYPDESVRPDRQVDGCRSQGPSESFPASARPLMAALGGAAAGRHATGDPGPAACFVQSVVGQGGARCSAPERQHDGGRWAARPLVEHLKSRWR